MSKPESQSLAPSTAPQTGRHRVEAELGRGGVGAVYRAVELATGRVVALKTLEQETALTLALFEREYYTLASIKHPRVIEVYDYAIAKDGRRYYTMELLEGNDLAALALVPWRTACGYFRDIAASLALLHARSLLHRDVSPRNVRVGQNGRAKLIDFGSVVPFGVARDVVGTPMCIAPEHLKHLTLDQRADLFSLGATAYFALTGRRPYAFKELRDAEEAFETPPVPISVLVPEVPPAVDQLVMSLLSVDPAARPASAAEVINRLGAAAELEEEEMEGAAAGHLLGTTLTGRDNEKAQIKQQLQRLSRAHGGTVIIEGADGMGRTRLATEAILEARLNGFLALRVDALAHPEPSGVIRGLLAELITAAPELAEDALRRSRDTLVDLLPRKSGRPTDPNRTKSKAPVQEVERRVLVQEAVISAFVEVAAQASLVIVVDDAHAADGNSAAALFGIAQAARDHHILVIATQRIGGVVPAAIQQLGRVGRTIKLGPLSDTAVDGLVASAFGDAPHRARLTQWLVSVAQGNPAHTLDLLSGLVARGVIRYEGGVWALPVEFNERDLPKDIEQTLRERVGRLSPATLTVAHYLALHHGGMGVDFCATLFAGRDRASLVQAFDELVAEGVSTVSGDTHRLKQEALRDILLSPLSSAERAKLDVTLGRALFATLDLPLDEAGDPVFSSASREQLAVALQAGLHLVSGGERQRSDRLLRAASWTLSVRGDGLGEAVPMLEAALEVYRAQNRPKHESTFLMVPLALAGIYSDARLNYKYGGEAFDALLESTGISRVRGWSRWVGGKTALSASLLMAAASHRFTSTRVHRDSFRSNVMSLMIVASANCGTCVIMMDLPRGQQFMEQLGPLSSLPEGQVPRVIYDYLEIQMEMCAGNYGRAMTKSRAFLARLCAPGGIRGMEETARLQLEVGIRGILANLVALRTDGDVGAEMEPLRNLRVGGARQVVAGALAGYHANRGESVAFDRAQREMDLLSAQSGSTWRQDITMLRSLWWVYALTEDVVGLKRVLRQLETFAENAPTLQDICNVAHACYLMERGRSAEALERFESMFERVRRHPNAHSLRFIGVYARILRNTAHADRALRVCDEALAGAEAGEKPFTIARIGVDLERTLALADLERWDEALADLDAIIERESFHDNPLVRGLAHKVRAQLGLRRGDEVAVALHLDAMREQFKKTENPALIAQCRRLTEESRRLTSDATLNAAVAASADVRSLRSAFASCRTATERYQVALEVIVDKAQAESGHLFLLDGKTLLSVATTEGETPAEALHSLAKDGIDDFESDEDMATAHVVSGEQDEQDAENNDEDARDDTDGTSEIDGRKYRAIVLWTTQGGRVLVVGAVVLEVAGEKPAMVDPGFLAEISRSLFELTSMSSVHTGGLESTDQGSTDRDAKNSNALGVVR